MSTVSAPLTLTDVCIAASVTVAGATVGVERVRAHFEYVMRRPLTFDEVSFGLPRLSRADLVVTAVRSDGSLALSATTRGMRLFSPQLGAIDAIYAMADALGVDLDAAVDDHSLGRQAGLVEAAFEELGGSPNESKIPVFAKRLANEARGRSALGTDGPLDARHLIKDV